jgi:hypothetical protein
MRWWLGMVELVKRGGQKGRPARVGQCPLAKILSIASHGK